jgi:hypothetical protein
MRALRHFGTDRYDRRTDGPIVVVTTGRPTAFVIFGRQRFVNGDQREKQHCAVASLDLLLVATTAICGAPAR